MFASYNNQVIYYANQLAGINVIGKLILNGWVKCLSASVALI